MDTAKAPARSSAFDHPETRAGWERTRRRAMGRFWLWTLLFVALLALSGYLNATSGTADYVKGGSNQLGPAIGGVAVLWYLAVLYVCLGSLSRLKKARSVLETYPWQELQRVRKAGREAAGIAVQLPLPGPAPTGMSTTGTADSTEDDTPWSPTMWARDLRRYNRWDDRLERGAWFAGDLTRWGVLALPGGTGLMTVHRSPANLAANRTSANKDYEKVLGAASRN